MKHYYGERKSIRRKGMSTNKDHNVQFTTSKGHTRENPLEN